MKPDKEKPDKKRPRCVVCDKYLKLFERNLCSCKRDVCMKHRQRTQHGCADVAKSVKREKLAKVVAPKIIKI
jgi:hypothetical protein